MRHTAAHAIATVFELFEILVHIGMRNRPRDRIRHQVLLTDIGDVIAVIAFCEEMVEGLVAIGANVFGNGFVPFVAIGKHRIDIEDHAAKIEHAVFNHIADGEAAFYTTRNVDRASSLGGKVLCAIHVTSRYGIIRGPYNGEWRTIPRILVKRAWQGWGARLIGALASTGASCPKAHPIHAERWQSGRMRRTRNAVYGQPYRGFESLPLRH